MYSRLGCCLLLSLAAGTVSHGQDPPAVRRFVNSKDGLTGDLLRSYVDFSFDYPAGWKKHTGGKDNFVKVERSTGKLMVTQESLAVGFYSGTGDPVKDKAWVEILLPSLEQQYKAGLPKFKKTAEGATKFGAYDGTHFRFTSEFPDPDVGTVNVWGRVVVVPDPNDARAGAMIIMLGTSHAPELKGEKDLGVKGELPVVIKSFKFGKR